MISSVCNLQNVVRAVAVRLLPVQLVYWLTLLVLTVGQRCIALFLDLMKYLLSHRHQIAGSVIVTDTFMAEPSASIASVQQVRSMGTLYLAADTTCRINTLCCTGSDHSLKFS